MGGGILSSGDFMSQLWEYDPITNSWTKREDLPTDRGRADASTFTLGSEGYVSCGFDGLGTPETWANHPTCPGTNNIRLQLTTDAFGLDTRWEIRLAGSTQATCGGNLLPSNTPAILRPLSGERLLRPDRVRRHWRLHAPRWLRAAAAARRRKGSRKPPRRPHASGPIR